MRKIVVVGLMSAPLAAGLLGCGDDTTSGVGGAGGSSISGPGVTHASSTGDASSSVNGSASATSSVGATSSSATSSSSASTAASSSSGGQQCGNGVLELGEECDDGNNVDGDTCEQDCSEPFCGNHITDPGETCDDGNTIDGDGCESDCTAPGCGNGAVDPGEDCDDGNTVNGDGCDNNCTTSGCGNGVVGGGEACDDGNTVNGDGCDNNCTATACGNGICSTGETQCSCGADCPTPANTCPACGCGVSLPTSNTCHCDALCIEFGDCCANETATCGTQSATFSFSATPTTPLAIPDGSYSGAQSSMACVPIVTPATGVITSVNSVQVTAVHTWVGDLTFKLVSPSGTVVTLMSIPGSLETADDGTGTSSESSNLAAANPITFVPTATVSAEAMGSTIDTAGTVCAPIPGGDGICSFIPNAGSAAAGTLGSFTGQAPTGTWQFCAGDSVSVDTGTINAVSINLTISG